jgi:hypothetical protein
MDKDTTCAIFVTNIQTSIKICGYDVVLIYYFTQENVKVYRLCFCYTLMITRATIVTLLRDADITMRVCYGKAAKGLSTLWSALPTVKPMHPVW